MTTNDAMKRRFPHLGRRSTAVARPTHRRDEIEAIGLVLGIAWILLVLVTAVGVSPSF